jgi:hypothetical protein
MTALVGREVERTFSGVTRYLTGLSSTETHKAGRQDVSYLVEPFGGANWEGSRGFIEIKRATVS